MSELFEAEALPVNQPPTKEADLNLGTSLCKLPDPKMAYDANGCCLRVGDRVAVSNDTNIVQQKFDELNSVTNDPEIFWEQIEYLVPLSQGKHLSPLRAEGHVRDIFNNGETVRVETKKPLGMWLLKPEHITSIFYENRWLCQNQ